MVVGGVVWLGWWWGWHWEFGLWSKWKEVDRAEATSGGKGINREMNVGIYNRWNNRTRERSGWQRSGLRRMKEDRMDDLAIGIYCIDKQERKWP